MRADRGRLISVCLLTYNHAHVLAQALQSILDQGLRDFELLCSDDCSTDGTWELLHRVRRTDRRVRVLRTPATLGMAGNANFAVARTDRPYIALLHHDDLYHATLLQQWLAVMESHPDVGFVFNAYAHAESARIDSQPLSERTPGAEFLRRNLFAGWGCPVRGTAMIRRACWERIGGLREQYGLLADVDLWMRLAARWRVGYVRAPLITVRHARPKDYASGYQGFSWRRKRLLFEIHAHNRASFYGTCGLAGRLARARLRFIVSLDVMQWLAYALIRRRWDILQQSRDGETDYEFRIVKWIRHGLIVLAGARARAC